MSDYLFLIAAILSGIHAFTYAKWLGKNGNNTGAAGVYIIIVIGLLLPLYSILIPN